MIVGARNFTCVAHAGSSTSTESTPPSSLTGPHVLGDLLPHRLVPTPEQPADRPPAGPPQRLDHAVERHRQRHRFLRLGLVEAHRMSDRTRCDLEHPVRICGLRQRRRRRDHDLSGRQVGEQRGRAFGVELGEHVIEHQHRRRPGAFGDQPVGGEPQRQRQRALLALRGVGSRRHPAEHDRHVVAVGTDGRDAAAHVVRRGTRRAPRPARCAAIPARTRAPPATLTPARSA